MNQRKFPKPGTNRLSPKQRKQLRRLRSIIKDSGYEVFYNWSELRVNGTRRIKLRCALMAKPTVGLSYARILSAALTFFPKAEISFPLLGRYYADTARDLIIKLPAL